MEEDGLADAFRTGSAEGFRAVYERYSGAVYAIALARPAAGRDGRRRQIHRRRTVRAGAAALLAAAAIVIGLVVTRGPATNNVPLAGTRLAPGASATAKLHAGCWGPPRSPNRSS